MWGIPLSTSTCTSVVGSDLCRAVDSTEECTETNFAGIHGNGGNLRTRNLQKLPLVIVDENGECIDLSAGKDKALEYFLLSRSILLVITINMCIYSLVKEAYDTHYLENLPEVVGLGPTTKKARTEPLSLYTCSESFLQEEPLVSENK